MYDIELDKPFIPVYIGITFTCTHTIMKCRPHTAAEELTTWIVDTVVIQDECILPFQTWFIPSERQ